MRDHERERRRVRGVGDARAALDAVVKLGEEAHGLLRARPADAGVAVEEEVDARVSGGRGVRVEDREVADAGRTRFLRMEVAVAEVERTRMREVSSAALPVAA